LPPLSPVRPHPPPLWYLRERSPPWCQHYHLRRFVHLRMHHLAVNGSI
jgi:hypothetical protein